MSVCRNLSNLCADGQGGQPEMQHDARWRQRDHPPKAKPRHKNMAQLRRCTKHKREALKPRHTTPSPGRYVFSTSRGGGRSQTVVGDGRAVRRNVVTRRFKPKGGRQDGVCRQGYLLHKGIKVMPDTTLMQMPAQPERADAGRLENTTLHHIKHPALIWHWELKSTKHFTRHTRVKRESCNRYITPTAV